MTFFKTKKGLKIYYTYLKNKQNKKPSKKSPTLIFIHGLSSESSSWQNYLNYFQKDYSVLSYDNRGFGKSSRPNKVKDYDPKLFVDDLKQLISHLKLKNVVLIGNSFGGTIAHELAVQKLKPVKAAFLITTPIGYKDVSWAFLSSIYLAKLVPNFFFKLLEPKLPFYKLTLRPSFFFKALANNPAWITINVLKNSKNKSIDKKIKIPNKVLVCNKDLIIKNKIRSIYPKTTVISGNHMSFITAHKKFCKLISNFLNTLK